MKKLLRFVFAILILCAFSLNSSASLITISITAQVTGVSDSYNLLEGKVEVNDIITGTYTYDTSTEDTNPAFEYGDYWHYSSPCGLELTAGGFLFKTDSNNIKFLIGAANNYQGYQDGYLVRSYNNLFLYDGVDVDHISWQLDDYSGTALSSTDLPITAPILSDWDYNNLVITGITVPPGYKKTFGIGAEVISAVLIPEPVSLLLFGFGLLLLRKQK
jgi:hypothetical protein